MSNDSPLDRKIKQILSGRRKYGTGSTLDAGNVDRMAYVWNSVVNINSEQFKALVSQVTRDDGATAIVLREHDLELLKMLRAWSQLTVGITKAINARVAEVEQLIKDNPEVMADIKSRTKEICGDQDETH